MSDVGPSSGAETATATAAWPVFEAARIGRELVAERTMAFRFAKPAEWAALAGQSGAITLREFR